MDSHVFGMAAGTSARWRRRGDLPGAHVHGAVLTLVALALVATGCTTRSLDERPDPDIELPADHDAGAVSDTAAQGHDAAASVAEPEPVAALPEPTPRPAEPGDGGARYSVVVNDVPVDELLFSLARDADIEIDIRGDIEGTATLNAVDQTLPRLLERIAAQAPIRYRIERGYIEIAADEPYLETYAVPYVNVERTTEAAIDTSTQIEQGALGEGGSRGNVSRTDMRSASRNRFWHSLERNLAQLLDVDTAGADEAIGSRDVIINREAGYVTVRATQGQHDVVRRFLDRVLTAARRQVLIEATVVEVQLDERYQRGIDWARLADGAKGFDFVQNLTGTDLGGALQVPDPDAPGEPALTVGYADPGSSAGDLRATLSALETFGDVRVVSSPRITALNNQQSLLKVVDNAVFFTVDVETTTREQVTDRVFETQVNSVPVGLVMAVTPYIGGDGEVLLNVRPTVSSILDFAVDPNPELAAANITNEIPEIQVREIESLLRVASGQTAVLGGLMQETVSEVERAVPGLSRLPLLGGLFAYRDNRTVKSELVIFLRPTVVTAADLDGDYSDYRDRLPTSVDGGSE